MLVLILGKEPPIQIQGIGLRTIEAAIGGNLESVYQKANSPFSLPELESRVKETVAWITWSDIAKIVKQQLETYQPQSKSVDGTVKRLAGNVIQVIDQHT